MIDYHHRTRVAGRTAPAVVVSLLLLLTASPAVLARGGVATPTREQERGAAFTALHAGPRASSARRQAEPAEVRWGGSFEEGSTPMAGGVRFVVRSENAERIELELFGHFDQVIEAERASQLGTPRRVLAMLRKGDLFVADVEGVGPGECYGFRAWGPNWPYDPAFVPGSEVGFVADVDAAGNRFNPNKLLFDPYARSLTRDPDWTGVTHASGPKHRAKDSAPYQAKGVVIEDSFQWSDSGFRRRPIKDSVIYEVHLRGLTKRFPGLANKGTYAALADDRVIAYLKDLGVTAVELLPIHETANDVNDVDPTSSEGDNYWGYMTLSYFAPDRRYSSDQSFDGPVREFQAMVDKLHANGLEVIVDVVYNHSAEGGTWKGEGIDHRTSTILSLRGLDNQLYYQLAGDNQFFYDNTGCGSNLRTAYPKTQDFILRSLKYYVDVLRVDGFRFDLASVLGNRIDRDGFAFQKTGGFLDRIARTFGYQDNDPYQNASKPKLIAEPWAIFDDTYQVGNFPWGWIEWNGKYRDTLRGFLKGETKAGAMMSKVNGSYELYGDDGRLPGNGVNFVSAHDGLSLFDLVSFNVNSQAERDALNLREWPYGPSDGGESHNHSWNCQVPGASPKATAALRRQQARNAFTVLMLSNGTPMILGGDERLRTTHGNNNTYNLDNEVTWLEWGPSVSRLNEFEDRVNHLDGVPMAGETITAFHRYARNLIRLRRAHPSFHAPGWWSPDRDGDGDGFPMLKWLGPDGGSPNPSGSTFAYRLDAAEQELGMKPKEWRSYPERDNDLLVMVNSGHQKVSYRIPAATGGKSWRRVVDTGAWAEAEGNYWPPKQQAAIDGAYEVNPRSVVVLIER